MTSQTVFKSQRPWQSKKNFKQLSHKSITEYISKGSAAAPSDHKPAGRTSRWNNLVRCAHRLPQGKRGLDEHLSWILYSKDVPVFCMLGGGCGVGNAGPQNWCEISDPEACYHNHPTCYSRWDHEKWLPLTSAGTVTQEGILRRRMWAAASIAKHGGLTYSSVLISARITPRER